MSSDCSHGMGPDSASLSARARLIRQLTESMETATNNLMQELGISPDADIPKEARHKLKARLYTSFLSNQDNQRLFDEKIVNLCWAYAAHNVKHGRFSVAELVTQIGIHIDAWIHCGGDNFVRFCFSGRPVTGDHDGPSLRKYFFRPMEQLAPTRNLVIFLSRKIPCGCLDQEKHEAKESPKVERCHGCGREEEKGKFKKCSRCQVAQYCSKECQIKDWNEGTHKRDCSMCKKMREAGMFK